MTEAQFNRILGKISSMPGDVDFEQFVQLVSSMMAMLDEGDYEDFFGTEGWRHRLGWD